MAVTYWFQTQPLPKTAFTSASIFTDRGPLSRILGKRAIRQQRLISNRIEGSTVVLSPTQIARDRVMVCACLLPQGRRSKEGADKINLRAPTPATQYKGWQGVEGATRACPWHQLLAISIGSGQASRAFLFWHFAPRTKDETVPMADVCSSCRDPEILLVIQCGVVSLLTALPVHRLAWGGPCGRGPYPTARVTKSRWYGLVAQWNRARVSEARSRGFDSLLALMRCSSQQVATWPKRRGIINSFLIEQGQAIAQPSSMSLLTRSLDSQVG